MSPTQRSLKELRDRGYIAGVVEKWNQYARVRQDLFGFVDIVAVREGGEMLLLQCTSDSNVSVRVEKVRGSPAYPILIGIAGVRVEVWGWGKKGARGKRKLWTLRKVVV